MTKASFLNHEKPLICSMLQSRTPERIIELMEKSRADGAEAYGMQFCQLETQYRNRDTYKMLFEKAGDAPVYVTNYRRGVSTVEKSDDELGKGLIELAECGATLCDIIGDFYAPCDGELTEDASAIKKQIELIDELHKRGAEVLMSTHVLKYTPAERVLEIALEHQRRGADICKIVTGADDMAQQIENLRIVDLLKQNLKIPFLYLSAGECTVLRRLGGFFGACMYLCVCEHDELSTKSQPLVKDVKILRDDLGL